MTLEPFKQIEYPSLSELSHQYPPVDWLWPAWIPNGMLTLFGAAPGVGKSLVALDLARRIIHGLPFPDGAPGHPFGRDVLIIDAEGAPALLNQRAQAWGLNTNRLYLMQSPNPSGIIDLSQSRQFKILGRMIRNIQPALVVIDSLAAASSRGETSLHSARDLLSGLAGLASMCGVALLVIHHLRKRNPSGAPASTRQVAIDDLRGSSHLSAAARSVLALSPVPTRSHALSASRDFEGPAEGSSRDFEGPAEGSSQACAELSRRLRQRPPEGSPTHPIAPSRPLPLSPSPPHPEPVEGRRLEVVKTNLCQHPPPLALRFEGENLAVPTHHYAKWVEPPSPPTQFELCARWLLDYLADADAPVKPAQVVHAAREVGFTRPTLYRARQALAGRILDLGNSPHDPHKRWTLQETQT